MSTNDCTKTESQEIHIPAVEIMIKAGWKYLLLPFIRNRYFHTWNLLDNLLKGNRSAE